jgi:hypothetical protein
MSIIKYLKTSAGTLAYTDSTQFAIQYRHGFTGSYKNKLTITGNPEDAYMYYKALNIAPGMTKRLTIISNDKPSAKHSVLAKFKYYRGLPE